MEQEVIDSALRTAQGISEYGIMVVICAFFVVISAVMMIAMLRWMMSTINDIMKSNKEMLVGIDKQMKEIGRIMQSVAESLQPSTDMQVKVTSKTMFNLTRYELIGIINTIREENHISDREATEAKIAKLVTNLHEDKNSEFSVYPYRGRKLSSYTNPKWIEWMKQGVIHEIYHEKGFNEDRMNTNINAIFDRIKLDFHHRINGL